jgi:hypothetical protein
MNIPNWRENLRFAALFQDYMERDYPQLTKPVFFCYRKYNMDLTPGSLLLEFGSNANTLEEAINAARMAGQALSNLILDNVLYEDVAVEEIDAYEETAEILSSDETDETMEADDVVEDVE